MNSLFDLSNSNSFYDGVRLDNLNEKIEELQQGIKWLQSLKFFKRDKATGEVSDKEYKGHHFAQGWQVSISSIIGLAKELVSKSQLTCLLTRKLTQDHVENGFSCVSTYYLV